MSRQVFKLHAHCLAVKGASRSLLCDLHLSRIRLIPNSLQEILADCPDMPLDQIKAHHQNEYNETIDEYFAFLIENDWGFWTDEPERWPKLNTAYQEAAKITNCLIDLDADSDFDLPGTLHQLEELGCEVAQIRIFDSYSPQRLQEIAAWFENSRFRTLDLITGYHPDLSAEVAIQLCESHARICQLQVHSAPFSKAFRAFPDRFRMGLVLFTEEKVTSHQHCGIVDPTYFAVSTSAILESLNHNSCLNRKLSVDTSGEICNCPSMPRRFGHVSEVPLGNILAKEAFTSVWDITKDQVAVCSDCEFRYICPDCRAHVEEAGNLLSKPAKCGYNPYTATWEKVEAVTFMEV